ncbi:MAG: IS200/IS605 family transposase [Acidobacteria bacterium]|nr:IS200/IS605 family transposase [Acidobacteriota bacterium]MBI3658213.1 IS200/IS605 family transposase [Acidobacteriota bacterium]
MPQSLSSLLVHLIFSTKRREPLITAEIESELHKYMATVFSSLKSPALLIGGTEDHIHTLFSLSRSQAVADLVKAVKTSSSKWIKTKDGRLGRFEWQTGYGAFSIGQSGVAALKRYIANQKEQHRRHSFQDELRLLCRKYGVGLDERYVWD